MDEAYINLFKAGARTAVYGACLGLTLGAL
ncbi:MAG: hypothetical protein K940chlam1_00335 [Candidatus Anoxychlamydiales bacterium]|nr:hypothetical protein [Candidatus Anoxychlamydiales bacterium]NGX35284.1 hypothetical protein [Candidatus Anoxychlamydiales bacterium]